MKQQDLSQENGAHEVKHLKKIKSFVMRAGRTTLGQLNAIQTLGPQFVIPYSESGTAPNSWFGEDHAEQPLIFEIGFGMGDATAKIAQSMPDHNFVGCEVHQPGVGALLMKIQTFNLQNLRIVSHDAVEVLEKMIPKLSLDGVHIFFPDPWHKTRHHKRRLLQTQFLELLMSRLKPNGYIHCATDWENYAQHMLNVFKAMPGLVNQGVLENGYAKRPLYRPVTKFETRGLKLGHGVWDLVFRLQSN
jgi:tRNA (guanine-N7-)-methyltransferase